MIKKIKIPFLIFLVLSSKAFACKCLKKTLIDEITESKNIFIGRVVDLSQNKYKIEINALYKGELDVNKTYEVIQPNDSCHKNLYQINSNYIFFESINGNGFRQCSRTQNIYESKVIKVLEKIYPNRIINQRNKTKTQEMIYDNLYLLRLFDGTKIDTNKKKLIYFDGKHIDEQPKIDFENNWLSTYFYLLLENIDIDKKKYDYVIFYKNSHQVFILNNKDKTKAIKKFLKRKSR